MPYPALLGTTSEAPSSSGGCPGVDDAPGVGLLDVLHLAGQYARRRRAPSPWAKVHVADRTRPRIRGPAANVGSSGGLSPHAPHLSGAKPSMASRRETTCAMRTPFRGQPHDRATTRLPVLAEPPARIPAERPAMRVLDGTPAWLVGPAGLEPATERL